MNKNGEASKNTMNSRLRALTLDPFIRDSGEKLTGRGLKRAMEEVDAAALPGRKRVSSPTMMVAAAWSRFACGGAVTSEKTKEEDKVEGLHAGRRRSIYGRRGVTVADLLRARSPRQFPRRRRKPHPTISRAVAISFGGRRGSGCLADRAILGQRCTRAILASEVCN